MLDSLTITWAILGAFSIVIGVTNYHSMPDQIDIRYVRVGLGTFFVTNAFYRFFKGENIVFSMKLIYVLFFFFIAGSIAQSIHDYTLYINTESYLKKKQPL